MLHPIPDPSGQFRRAVAHAADALGDAIGGDLAAAACASEGHWGRLLRAPFDDAVSTTNQARDAVIASRWEVMRGALCSAEPARRAWAVLSAALAADADANIASPENASAWRAQHRRLYGPLETIEDASALVIHSPGAGLAMWRVVGAVRKGLVDPNADISWLLENAGPRLAIPDNLSQDERTDIPSRPPLRVSSEVDAGICNAAVECAVASPIDPDLVLHVQASVDVRLAITGRGAHMSRMQEAVQAQRGRRFVSLLEVAEAIAADVMARQPSRRVLVDLSASLVAPWRSRLTDRPSSVTLNCRARVTHELTTARARLELGVGVMTACPCTLRYSRLATERALGLDGDSLPTPLPPTFTHSQPGTLTVVLEGRPGEMLGVQHLWDALSASAHLRQAVLKRPDEHDLVREAHERPQFCEDLVREAAAQLAARCPEPGMVVGAHAALDESIHPHRAVAAVEGPAAAFWATHE